MYKVIATGSTGNAILYHDSILVDCGVPYSLLKSDIKKIQIILLTHEHGDHLNLSTLEKISFERPSIRFACGSFLLDKVKHLRNVDVLEAGNIYNYGQFKISPVTLYHDVSNFGYRIMKGEHRTIHVTDTGHLQGITAPGYNLYAIEHNYDADSIDERIKAKTDAGEFSHEKGVINSHLSEQQAQDFIYQNKIGDAHVLKLHKSTTYI